MAVATTVPSPFSASPRTTGRPAVLTPPGVTVSDTSGAGLATGRTPRGGAPLRRRGRARGSRTTGPTPRSPYGGDAIGGVAGGGTSSGTVRLGAPRRRGGVATRGLRRPRTAWPRGGGTASAGVRAARAVPRIRRGRARSGRPSPARLGRERR